MFNADLTALHLLNFREEFFLLSFGRFFFFFVSRLECYVAPQKIRPRMLPQRDPPQIGH